MDGLTNAMLENECGQDRYSDPTLMATTLPHEIPQQSIQAVKELLHAAVDDADALIALTLGRCVTETKASLIEQAESKLTDLPSAAECSALFAEGKVLKRNIFYHFAWSEINHDGEKSTLLFCAGETYQFNDREHAIMLSEHHELTSVQWSQLQLNEQSVDRLCELISDGAWNWSPSP